MRSILARAVRELRRSSRMHFRPSSEEVEQRVLLSFADGNGPVVTAITETPGSNQLVISFDGPLDRGSAEDLANYQVTRAFANPELITSSGPAVKILNATYSDTTVSEVTLTTSIN